MNKNDFDKNQENNKNIATLDNIHGLRLKYSDKNPQVFLFSFTLLPLTVIVMILLDGILKWNIEQ